MGRIGKTYRRDAEAYPELFDREASERLTRGQGVQLAGALILVVAVLGVIGWAFTL